MRAAARDLPEARRGLAAQRRLALWRALFLALASLAFLYAAATEGRAKYLTGVRLSNWALLLACMRFAAALAEFVSGIAHRGEPQRVTTSSAHRVSRVLAASALPLAVGALQQEVVDDRVPSTLVALSSVLVLCVADACLMPYAPPLPHAAFPVALFAVWAAVNAVARSALAEGEALRPWLLLPIAGTAFLHTEARRALA